MHILILQFNHESIQYLFGCLQVILCQKAMNIKILLVTCLLISAFCIRDGDKVNGPPGMKDTVVYSGFLDTNQNDRKLHYVFVQADQNSSTAPLTVWFNGGPGCSSLIGYMQEIGPYKVGDTYNHGQDLIKNDYRWNKASNVLFVESPGIVGFSTDTNKEINYSDKQTADDSFAALKDFIWKVAPQFSARELYLTGESYAGKYIPDVAVRILNHNRDNTPYINIKGILVGNGIMNHVDNSLKKSRIQFMIDHDFFSERLLSVYRTSCEIDFNSPRCQYFKYEFNLLRGALNAYDVYELCQKSGNSIEKIRTEQFLDMVQKKLNTMKNAEKYGQDLFKSYQKPIELKQINSCPSDQGMIDYLNMYKAVYNAFNVKKNWAPCTDLKYDITDYGSMDEYKQIFLNKAIKVWFYNGDWDDVVPYPDTLYNLNLLRRTKVGDYEPWFVGQDHAGFYQMYDSLSMITIKGAGHQVPFFKPKGSYQMFYNFIKNRPINTPV